MIEIRYAEPADKVFWFSHDRHLSECGFDRKVRDKQGYVLLENDEPVALLRYNLFWDSIPFCTMLYVVQEHQRKGYGTLLMRHWEADMKWQGCGMVMVSTQSDEDAQHFYRRLGYKDSGSLIIDIKGYEQPSELFFIKSI